MVGLSLLVVICDVRSSISATFLMSASQKRPKPKARSSFFLGIMHDPFFKTDFPVITGFGYHRCCLRQKSSPVFTGPGVTG